MKKVNKEDIFYLIWCLMLFILSIALLLVVIFNPKENITLQIISIILASINVLISTFMEGYAIYSLISNIKKNSKEK